MPGKALTGILRFMNRTIDYDGLELHISLYFIGRNHKVFDVYRCAGMHWPTDLELITLADGGDPEGPEECWLHKGGEVAYGDNEDHRIVTVFV